MSALGPVNPPLAHLSVLVSSYNKCEFLRQSELYLHEIAKLGAQVVIIEDSSTDKSIEIIENWDYVKSGLIELIVQKNSGSAAARNKAISVADRNYLLFVDIDDEVDVKTLVTIFPRVLASDADLGVAGYKQMPARRIGPYPLIGFAGRTTQIALHRTELFEGVGWWRYLYKRATVNSKNLHFVPTFEQMRGQIFVLDDIFWLLHIFSLELSIYRANSDDILYNYFLPDATSANRRKWYLDQVLVMPAAMSVFLMELKTHACSHDDNWLYTKSFETLWQHANLLNLKDFLRGANKFIKTSVQIEREFKYFGLHKTIAALATTFLRLTYRALRSVANPNPTSRS
jgi:glycosyltransferase involved in cell wall biosynthesis